VGCYNRWEEETILLSAIFFHFPGGRSLSPKKAAGRQHPEVAESFFQIFAGGAKYYSPLPVPNMGFSNSPLGGVPNPHGNFIWGGQNSQNSSPPVNWCQSPPFPKGPKTFCGAPQVLAPLTKCDPRFLGGPTQPRSQGLPPRTLLKPHFPFQEPLVGPSNLAQAPQGVSCKLN